MRLAAILQPDRMKIPLVAADRRGAIDELVDVLADSGDVSDREGIKEAVWPREQIRTTGIGHGIAIPHAKSACCEKLGLAVGVPDEPIDFDAVDGQPVRIIFLLISAADQTGPHIQALATISRILTDSNLRAAITEVASAQQLHKLLVEHEDAAE